MLENADGSRVDLIGGSYVLPTSTEKVVWLVERQNPGSSFPGLILIEINNDSGILK